jgi:hypothetical protein
VIDHWKETNAAAEQFRGAGIAELATMIKSDEQVIATFWRDEHAARQAGMRREANKLRFAMQNAIARQKAMERRLAIDFGAARGWTLSPSSFGLNTLSLGKQHAGGRHSDEGNGWFRGDIANCFDHPCWYRCNRKAAAIVAHLYGMPSCRNQCEAVAARFGLIFEVPDFPSWWNPGSTTLVIYVGPAGLCSSDAEFSSSGTAPARLAEIRP